MNDNEYINNTIPKKVRINPKATPKEITRVWKRVLDVPHTINGDGTIDIHGFINITHLRLNVIPFYFNHTDNFSCAHNNITSLEGSPKTVTHHYRCRYNDIETLEYAPERVGQDFDCFGNKLYSLKGGPRDYTGLITYRGNSVKFDTKYLDKHYPNRMNRDIDE